LFTKKIKAFYNIAINKKNRQIIWAIFNINLKRVYSSFLGSLGFLSSRPRLSLLLLSRPSERLSSLGGLAT